MSATVRLICNVPFTQLGVSYLPGMEVPESAYLAFGGNPDGSTLANRLSGGFVAWQPVKAIPQAGIGPTEAEMALKRARFTRRRELEKLDAPAVYDIAAKVIVPEDGEAPEVFKNKGAAIDAILATEFPEPGDA